MSRRTWSAEIILLTATSALFLARITSLDPRNSDWEHRNPNLEYPDLSFEVSRHRSPEGNQVLSEGSLFNVSGDWPDNSRCHAYPCLNGGNCSHTDAGDGVDDSQGYYNCTCHDGYAGHNCDVDLCNPSPCLNGGDCIVGDGPLYSCSCLFNFTGIHCEVPLFTEGTTIQTTITTASLTTMTTILIIPTSEATTETPVITTQAPTTPIETTTVPTEAPATTVVALTTPIETPTVAAETTVQTSTTPIETTTTSTDAAATTIVVSTTSIETTTASTEASTIQTSTTPIETTIMSAEAAATTFETSATPIETSTEAAATTVHTSTTPLETTTASTEAAATTMESSITPIETTTTSTVEATTAVQTSTTPIETTVEAVATTIQTSTTLIETTISSTEAAATTTTMQITTTTISSIPIPPRRPNLDGIVSNISLSVRFNSTYDLDLDDSTTDRYRTLENEVQYVFRNIYLDASVPGFTGTILVTNFSRGSIVAKYTMVVTALEAFNNFRFVEDAILACIPTVCAATIDNSNVDCDYLWNNTADELIQAGIEIKNQKNVTCYSKNSTVCALSENCVVNDVTEIMTCNYKCNSDQYSCPVSSNEHCVLDETGTEGCRCNANYVRVAWDSCIHEGWIIGCCCVAAALVLMALIAAIITLRMSHSRLIADDGIALKSGSNFSYVEAELATVPNGKYPLTNGYVATANNRTTTNSAEIYTALPYATNLQGESLSTAAPLAASSAIIPPPIHSINPISSAPSAQEYTTTSETETGFSVEMPFENDLQLNNQSDIEMDELDVNVQLQFVPIDSSTGV